MRSRTTYVAYVSFRAVFIGVVLLSVFGVVGLAWKGWDAASEYFDRDEAKAQICSTLDAADRRDLLSTDTPKKLSNVEGALDSYTCRWATEDFRTVPAFVEAVSAPADKWATHARSALPSLLARSDANTASRLRKAADNATTSADGCRFAKLLFQATGARQGSNRLVAPVATSVTGAPAMLAQSCVDGTYAAVLVTAPGLKLDQSLARKTAGALRKVEDQLG